MFRMKFVKLFPHFWKQYPYIRVVSKFAHVYTITVPKFVHPKYIILLLHKEKNCVHLHKISLHFGLYVNTHFYPHYDNQYRTKYVYGYMKFLLYNMWELLQTLCTIVRTKLPWKSVII